MCVSVYNLLMVVNLEPCIYLNLMYVGYLDLMYFTKLKGNGWIKVV